MRVGSKSVIGGDDEGRSIKSANRPNGFYYPRQLSVGVRIGSVGRGSKRTVHMLDAIGLEQMEEQQIRRVLF